MPWNSSLVEVRIIDAPCKNANELEAFLVAGVFAAGFFGFFGGRRRACRFLIRTALGMI